MAPGASNNNPLIPGSIHSAPLPNGLVGACLLLAAEHDPNFVGGGRHGWHVTGLTGYWKEPPPLSEFKRRSLMIQARPIYRNHPFHLLVVGNPPKRFVPIGTVDLKPKELKEAKSPPHSLATTWKTVSERIYLEWCWINDREKCDADDERRHLALQKVFKDMERRAHGRSQTLAQLRRRRPFASWQRLWGKAAAEEAHAIYSDCLQELTALGPTPDHGDCRRILRSAITRFNGLQAQRRCIETVEREDIIDALQNIVGTLGIPEVIESLTSHREW